MPSPSFRRKVCSCGEPNWAERVSRSGRFDAIADNHRDSVPDLRIGITPASLTEAPQEADDRRPPHRPKNEHCDLLFATPVGWQVCGYKSGR